MSISSISFLGCVTVLRQPGIVLYMKVLNLTGNVNNIIVQCLYYCCIRITASGECVYLTISVYIEVSDIRDTFGNRFVCTYILTIRDYSIINKYYNFIDTFQFDKSRKSED